MVRRIRIIANPVSGQGRAARLARTVTEILRGRGCEVELAYTERAGDARRLASEASGCDAVCAVGGDGTINEVANGLSPSGPALGVIPSGTANVMARELGLRKGAPALADAIADGREIRWDLGIDRVSQRRFLLFASMGYDASVVHLFHAKRQGPIRQWQYLWWGLKSIVDFRIPRIGVEINGREVTRSASWVQISNVASYGGPLVFTPHARVDDGRFEVMVMRGRRKRDVVRMFWAALLGYFLRFEYRMEDVTFHEARKVRVWSEDGSRVPIQVDGDPGGHLPFDAEIVPGGMRVLAP